MATNKMAAIKLAKLKSLLPVIQTEVKALTADLVSIIPDIDIRLANCVLVNNLAANRLQEAGFKEARFVAGVAAFGVNKGKFGVIDHGYSNNALMMDGTTVQEANGFNGHAWVELPKLGVIVDLTLPNLEQAMLRDNANRGLTDTDFLLSKDMIVSMASTTTFEDLLDNYRIGHHYRRNAAMTEFAQSHIELLASMLKQNGLQID